MTSFTDGFSKNSSIFGTIETFSNYSCNKTIPIRYKNIAINLIKGFSLTEGVLTSPKHLYGFSLSMACVCGNK